MLVYDLITDARTILIDNSSPYRWSDDFFYSKYKEIVNILWSARVAYFLDKYCCVSKDYKYLSTPIQRLTAYTADPDVYYHSSDEEFFYVSTSGTTGAVEPTYNLGYNQTTTDGTVVFTNIERQDLPFPDFIRDGLTAYLISKAYELDSTDQNNAVLSDRYMQIFKGII